MKHCIAGVRRPGEHAQMHEGENEPSVWFPSTASLAAVLSDDNRALLRIIHTTKPKSLTELAELTGRKVPNLSRTLKTMAGYGLVALERNIREIKPKALATEFLVVLK